MLLIDLFKLNLYNLNLKNRLTTSMRGSSLILVLEDVIGEERASLRQHRLFQMTYTKGHKTQANVTQGQLFHAYVLGLQIWTRMVDYLCIIGKVFVLLHECQNPKSQN